MKMKKLFSVFMVLLLVVSICELPASAVVRARTVSILPTTRTLRIGRTMQLEERVYPSDVIYDEVEWSTSDFDVIEVDMYGELTAMNYGEATITCRIYGEDDNGNRIRLGTNSVVFTVPGGKSSSSEEEEEPSSTPKPVSISKPVAEPTSKISTSDLNAAVKKALTKGKTTSATFKDVGSVSASALQSAALTMQNGGGTVLLNFDTTTNGRSVEGRLRINPAASKNVRGDIKLGVYTNDDAVSSARNKFKKYFKNDTVIIKAAHSGSYGMNVTYAVKIGSTLAKSNDLRLYSYAPSTNKYREIKNSNIRIDSNGYVHFTTSLGDYLVVSGGALRK